MASLWSMSGAAKTTSRVVLVVGPEEVLAERAVATLTRDAHTADADTEVSELDAASLEVGHFLEVTGPTLFGTPRLVVLRGLPPAGAAHDAVLAYAGDPDEDVTLVVVHDGAARSKKVLDGLRQTGAREISCAKLSRREERLDFLRAEAADAGGRITPGA